METGRIMATELDHLDGSPPTSETARESGDESKRLPDVSTEFVVEAVRLRGSDARDLRDAVHEAHHAISSGLRGKWERERVHQALLRMPRVKKWGVAMLVQEEVDARAVERLACAKFGIEYDSEYWAMMAAMETCKTLGVGMPPDWWIAQIGQRCTEPRITLALDALIKKLTTPRKDRQHG